MQTYTSARIGIETVAPIQKIRYCLYARKSTESDEKQALSIESQIKEMQSIAERDGLEVVEIRRESHSAKDSGQRPVYTQILQDIREGKFNGILTWAPDRLSRNAGDLGSIVDLMDQKRLLEIRTYGQQFKNSPNEKFLLMILCSQAKLENDNKSINVKRGLRTRCEMGLRPGVAAIGYLNEKRLDRKCHVTLDPNRADIIRKIFEKVGYQKWSGRKVYDWLKNEVKIKSNTGKTGLTLSNVYLILQNPFYYGVFEYPVGSGNWYTGKHEPLITKELFDLVQVQVKSKTMPIENKEFAFTKLITCGLCGSGITADEKFKRIKDGTINRHVYYLCTKARDKYCKCGYINENDLIQQFINLMDEINIDEISIKQKIKNEIERIKKFNKNVLGTNEVIEAKEIDIRNYAKHILKQGSDTEKRELLGCFGNKIKLINKKIHICG